MKRTQMGKLLKGSTVLRPHPPDRSLLGQNRSKPCASWVGSTDASYGKQN